MNTEKAVEYLKGIIYDDTDCEFIITNADRDKISNIITLLKRGEKFEAMWNDLWEGLEFKPNKDLLHMNYEDFISYMKEIKQKYFPKSTKKEEKE